MSPNLFLTNFGHIANAPGGMSRLREMIYSLAATGSLSEQRESDGDGHSLLKEIYAKKQALCDAGRFKRTPKLENLRGAYNESLPTIPSTWAWGRLVEVGEISPKNEADDGALASFVPMSAISEMHSSAVASEDRPWGNIKKAYTHIANGDVALAKITPCFENGKAAVMENLTNGIGAGTTELHVVRPIAGMIEPGYIYSILRSPYFRIVGEGHMTGTAGQKRLPTEYFATRPFPLPPLAEQKRIVAKVDELMALCDQLESQQQERAQLFAVLSRTCHDRFTEVPSPRDLNRIFNETVVPTDLRETIMTLAIRGHLVRRIESEGTGLDVLKRADVTNRESVDAPEVPAHWVWARLGNVATRMESGWSPACNLQPAHRNEWGVLKTTSVQPLRYHEEQNKQLPRNLRPRPEHEVMDGDLLITRAGPMNRVGIVCVARPTRPKLMISDKIIRFHLIEGIDPDFVALAFTAGHTRATVEGLKSGMASSQVNISQPKLRTVAIPIPPAGEQCRIVAKVSEILALIDTLEALQQERDKLAEAFAKACVASFTGTAQPERPEKMKAPQTQLVSIVTLGKRPETDTMAPLAKLLVKNDGTLHAKALWQQSGLSIDEFYQQLKSEIAEGWIAPPVEAEMKVVGEV